MKKIVTIILSIMLIFQTTFGATLTVIINGAQITSTREAQEEVELTPKLDRIIGWQVNTGNVTIENNKFIMPNENVEIEAILSEADKYELTVENMYVTTTEEKEEGKEVVVTATSNDEYMFIGWMARGITLTDDQKTNSELAFTMPGNDVTLEANYSVNPQVGDYIWYTPGSGTTENDTVTITGAESGLTEYNETLEESEKLASTDQIFTANATAQKWRVIANNGGQVDIIPAEGSIGDLTLYGKTGYANSIGILNSICEKYANSTYATRARSLGYEDGVYTITGEISCNAVSSKEEASSNFWNAFYDDDYETAQSYVSSLIPYMDIGWFNLATNTNDEMSILREIGVKNAWLASRGVYINVSFSVFYVYYLDNYGDVSKHRALFASNSDGSGGSIDYSMYNSNGVCPVVSLKSGIKITGQGTEAFPYSMSID